MRAAEESAFQSWIKPTRQEHMEDPAGRASCWVDHELVLFGLVTIIKESSGMYWSVTARSVTRMARGCRAATQIQSKTVFARYHG